MGKRNPKFDAYIEKTQPFAQPILKYIRSAVHSGCPGVEEELKWGHPSFMYKGILCGMAAFKQHVTFGFWKASALNPTAKSADAWGDFGRITSVKDLPDKKTFVGLVKQAAAMHDAGVKAPWIQKRKARQPIPEPAYFTTELKKNKSAQKTYDALSPSHKREYLEWITEAKREDTRERRLATAIEWLAEGKPRNWKHM